MRNAVSTRGVNEGSLQIVTGIMGLRAHFASYTGNAAKLAMATMSKAYSYGLPQPDAGDWLDQCVSLSSGCFQTNHDGHNSLPDEVEQDHTDKCHRGSNPVYIATRVQGHVRRNREDGCSKEHQTQSSTLAMVSGLC